jgi:hypothetical protein
MGIFVKDKGKIKVNPVILFNFTKEDVVLVVSLKRKNV